MTEYRMKWEIGECREIIHQLHQKGLEAKDHVAQVFGTFFTELPYHWYGNNFNKVVEFTNQYIPEMENKFVGLATTIPTYMQDAVNREANDGQGVEEFTLSHTDNDHPWIWETHPEKINVNGNIKIEIETVKKYFQDPDHWILGHTNEAKEALEAYVMIFENGMSYFDNNEAILKFLEAAKSYKDYVERSLDEIIGTVVEVAMQEINGIEEVDLSTIKIAQNVVEIGSTGENEITQIPKNTAGDGKLSSYVPSNSTKENSSKGYTAGFEKIDNTKGKSSEGYTAGFEKIDNTKGKSSEGYTVGFEKIDNTKADRGTEPMGENGVFYSRI